jgi:replication-associated recombination protein RarA
MSTSQPLLFNPSRVSLEELEETFVGRWALLRQMETDLLDDAKKNINRHWLLIGPRGSGKSHLTELLARRLGRDHNWPVVRLPEEQYQVADLAQLLEQIVIRLEQLSTSPFSGRSSRDVQELALDRIRTFKTKRGTHIVVILENLTKFFQRKLNRQSEQKRLREILSRDAPFVLLTTATSFVEATLQESAPFYDFFHVLTLDDLSQEEVASLIEARAKWDREETLLSSPDLVRSRVEAVYHFSGGNPRLVLDLYSILRRGITDDLHQQLLKLLDEVTPYYQARLDDITPQMERVLSEMALAEQRLTLLRHPPWGVVAAEKSGSNRSVRKFCEEKPCRHALAVILWAYGCLFEHRRTAPPPRLLRQHRMHPQDQPSPRLFRNLRHGNPGRGGT